jgi:hypothetical protein
VEIAEDRDELVLVGAHDVVEPTRELPAIFGRHGHDPQPTRSYHPFGGAGRAQGLPSYTIVIRLTTLPRSDASTEVMALLAAGVPLTLLIDLADPQGPPSRDILLAVLITDDVARDGRQLLRIARDMARNDELGEAK